MVHRRTGTFGAIFYTLLLAGVLAEIGHLDRLVRDPRAATRGYLRPEQPLPRAAAPGQPSAATDDFDNPEQRAQYDAQRRKTILELQPFRRSEGASIGARPGGAVLTNLNPDANAWFLLTLDWGGGARVTYHLENPDPLGQHIHLVEGQAGPTITGGTASNPCELWSGKPSALEKAVATKLPYAPLCEGRLYLRNRVAGNYTSIEAMTDFLRENIWKGEDIVVFVRESVYRDAYRETGKTAQSTDTSAAPADAPPSASVNGTAANQSVGADAFGIAVDAPTPRLLGVGRWYPVRNLSGVYASLMLPRAVNADVVAGSKGVVNMLDSVEAGALVVLTAFDLSQFEMGFGLGTDHPRLNWSPRVAARDGLPGPDGIDSPYPLVPNGMMNPALLPRVVATFAGGYKREHGAFIYGDLANVHHNSHYGFIEQGVVFSKLQPGLATLYALDDGSIHMETWSEDNNRFLSHVRFARQNGVPLVELNAAGNPAAGRLVRYWGAGNWSGSADAKLRTLRAGACLVEANGKQYLLHAIFTTATPSAMALVFQAYGCRYAMLLDMNALEHSYLALYARDAERMIVEHPLTGMNGVDRSSGRQLAPRFITYPDNRDFFYLVRRKSNP